MDSNICILVAIVLERYNNSLIKDRIIQKPEGRRQKDEAGAGEGGRQRRMDQPSRTPGDKL